MRNYVISKEKAIEATWAMIGKEVLYIGSDESGKEKLYTQREWDKTNEDEITFVGNLYTGRINDHLYDITIYEDGEEGYIGKYEI